VITAEADNGPQQLAPDGGLDDEGDVSVAQRACGYGLPCDPTNLGTQTCETLGLPAGQLGCDPNTCFLVLTSCGAGSVGTGVVNGGGGTGAPAAPALFGGVTATDGGLFGGGLFGGQPGGQPGTADEDGGTPAGPGGFFGGGPGRPGGNAGGRPGGGPPGNAGGFFGGTPPGGGNAGGVFGGGGQGGSGA